MNYKKLLLPIFSLAILSALVLISARAQTPQIPQNPALGSSWARDFVAQNPEYKDVPITDRTEKSITFQRSDGQLVTQAVDFPIHYKNARGEWQPLDTTLKYFPETGEWGAPGFGTRIKPDGEVNIYPVRSRSSLMTEESQGDSVSNGVYTQKTISFGTFDENTKEFKTLGQFQEGSANGNTLIRKSNEVEHKIKLTDLGVKEEMIIPEAPEGISENDYLAMKTEIGSEKLFPDGWLDEASMAEHHLPAPFSFDANQKPIPTQRYTQYIDGKQYVYTGILGSSLLDVVYPVTIDPDYLCSTNDGHVLGTSTTYAVARSTSNLFNSVLAYFRIGQQFATPTYYVYRGFLKFDTSPIPDTDTVTQVNLKMVCTISSTSDFDVQIVKQDWSAQDPLSTANREAAYDNCLAGTADDNIWRNTLGIVINTQYASGNLNTAWINKIGSTYYSLRSSRDFNNNTPTGEEFVDIASQNYTTVAYRPILTVVHVHPLFKLFYNVKLFQNVKFFYTP